MSIQELLSKFEPAKLKVQFLHECLSDLQANKKCAKVTFETDAITPNSLVGETEPVGIIVWIPRDDWNEMKKGRQNER